MAENYFIEVISNGRGLYHERGAGLPNDHFLVNEARFALGMSREFAVARARTYRGWTKARVVQAQSRAQLDHAVVVVDWHEPLGPVDTGLSLHNNFAEQTYRDVFEGRDLELRLLLNRSLGMYFLKFTTSTNPLDPPDVSIPGKTPAEVFQKLTQNPAYRPYHDRFVVEPLEPPAPPAPLIAGPDEVFVRYPNGQVTTIKKNY